MLGVVETVVTPVSEPSNLSWLSVFFVLYVTIFTPLISLALLSWCPPYRRTYEWLRRLSPQVPSFYVAGVMGLPVFLLGGVMVIFVLSAT
jgi:hypothetical protein